MQNKLQEDRKTKCKSMGEMMNSYVYHIPPTVLDYLCIYYILYYYLKNDSKLADWYKIWRLGSAYCNHN